MRRSLVLIAALAVGCIASPPRAEASGLGCNVSTTPLVFGSYAPLSGAQLTASGAASVNCLILGGTVQIALSSGGGSFTPRTMLGPGGAKLKYNLYTSAAYTTIWGDGTSGTATVALVVPLLAPASATIYGLVPGAQDVPVGSYSSTVTATITF